MASDGQIRIDVEVDSRTVVRAGGDLNRLETSAVQAGQGAARTSSGIKELATSLGLVAIAAKAMDVLKSAIGGAISRFDTLSAFPVVMERMGFSSEAAEKSINKLSDGIQGLPTTLDGIVSSTQRIAVLTGDLEVATDTALALNNAFLASGASAGDAQRGLTQYVQMLSKGTVDLMSWRTLQETMGYALKETAAEFGFTGASAQNELYDALKDGDVVFGDFNAKLIELNDGVGGFADMAASGSAGIATSFGNLKNAVTVGVANIIGSFDRLTKEVTGKNLAENLDGLKAIVKTSFKVIGNAIEGAAPAVIVFSGAVQATIPVVKALAPAILGLMAAYGAYVVVAKFQVAILAANKAIAAAQATTMALTIATNARVASQITATTVDRAGTTAIVAQTGAITLSTFAIGVLRGTITASTAAKIIATTVTYAFSTALKVLAGPLGWLIAAAGLLVAGVVGIVKWFNKATEEGERLGKETEKVASATDTLKTSIEDNVDAYKKNQDGIESSSIAYGEMAAKVEELAAKEKLSAEEKKELNSYIDELNKNVSGLNLVYGEETKALSASSEQIANRISLMQEEEKLQAAQERMTEIIKEQAEAQMQLEEINLLREEWALKLEEGTVKSKEHKTALEELQLQEDSLKEANKLAGEQRLALDTQIVESSAAVAAAAERDTGRQLLMLDELSESAQTTVESMKASWDEYAAAATDMFDRLSEKSELSVGEMTANLEENQRIIGNWADNVAALAERGIDEGLLNTLREAGPESAGHVNALVNASDTELEKLSGLFAEGGAVATDALSKSLGIENSGVLDAVGHLVIDTEQSLKAGIDSANFSGLGGDVSDGFAGGMKDGTPEAEKAATDMADKTTQAAKKALDSHSPSRVFKTIGGDTADGYALGINSGTNAVMQAMKNLSQSAIKQFVNTPTQFNSIGKNAMAGLNQGLWDGSGRVLSTARSIANSVASTMRHSLQINSPSRVMRNDVGRWVPEGIAMGIKENASSVYDALKNLSSGMVLPATPEMALGTASMGRVGSGIPKASTNPVPSSTTNTVNSPITGNNFYVREEADINKVSRELHRLQQDALRGEF